MIPDGSLDIDDRPTHFLRQLAYVILGWIAFAVAAFGATFVLGAVAVLVRGWWRE